MQFTPVHFRCLHFFYTKSHFHFFCLHSYNHKIVLPTNHSSLQYSFGSYPTCYGSLSFWNESFPAIISSLQPVMILLQAVTFNFYTCCYHCRPGISLYLLLWYRCSLWWQHYKAAMVHSQTEMIRIHTEMVHSKTEMMKSPVQPSNYEAIAIVTACKKLIAGCYVIIAGLQQHYSRLQWSEINRNCSIVIKQCFWTDLQRSEVK